MVKPMLMSLVLLLASTLADHSRAAAATRFDLEQKLYQGVRATDLLAARVVSQSGLPLGQIRNVELADDGRITAVIAERAGTGTTQEFVFRLPWQHVVKPLRNGPVVADLTDPESRLFSLFPQANGNQDSSSSRYLISQVVGDYVRLQTGRGYGYVKDAVFSEDGRMFAVLVARAAPDGGTVAFPYPGRTGRWDAAMSYYGLPFVTSEQADEAGLKVDKAKFSAMPG
jgi:sporulation protein YlmC with PRC-barrel domain